MLGRGKEGQLGRGEIIESEASYRTNPKQVLFFKNFKILRVAAGGDHTLALATEDKN